MNFFLLYPPFLHFRHFIVSVCNPLILFRSLLLPPFSSIRFNMVIKAGNYIISRITTAPVRHDKDNRALQKAVKRGIKMKLSWFLLRGVVFEVSRSSGRRLSSDKRLDREFAKIRNYQQSEPLNKHSAL